VAPPYADNPETRNDGKTIANGAVFTTFLFVVLGWMGWTLGFTGAVWLVVSIG
jgi:hypothetical protein